ncbi:hypothetical protein [Burkholderia sp. LAS2]|uniref:hypothetical protein n=1 Tax=Burkholderia sp. LAS2 TaxID=2813843 RepID=UPI001BCCA0CB|nr:hypothetical protein [Burkholderia sp. LAS2]QVN14796.1 hypothetical protein JYG37_22090 [Burkholderia sp. LAS2]
MNTMLERGRLVHEHSEFSVDMGDRIQKLSQNLEEEASFLKGLLYTLQGNIDAAIATFRGSMLPPSERELQVFIAYSNLGYASHALEHFRAVASPETGSFTKNVYPGLSIGAVRTIARFISQAETMHLTNMDGVPVDLLRTAEEILEEAGTDDNAITRVLDVAGAVVREYGLVHVGNVQLDAFRSLSCVKLRYRFAITPDEAVWLYNEFLGRLYDEEVPLPPAFAVAFEGQNITH